MLGAEVSLRWSMIFDGSCLQSALRPLRSGICIHKYIILWAQHQRHTTSGLASIVEYSIYATRYLAQTKYHYGFRP